MFSNFVTVAAVEKRNVSDLKNVKGPYRTSDKLSVNS